MDRFAECHPITAAHEGGWSDHKDDPGGATMYGVTQAVYDAWRVKRGLPRRSVRMIEKSEALEIYRKNYWEASGAPALFPGVDLSVYDAAVNSGVARARKWLLASAGNADNAVTVRKICRARLSFMQSLAIWKTFGKGWGRRVADIEVRGVATALKAQGNSGAQIRAMAMVESAGAVKSASNARKGEQAAAAGAAADVAAASYVDASSVDWTALALLGAFGLAIILLIVFLNARKRADQERAAAYAALAVDGGEA